MSSQVKAVPDGYHTLTPYLSIQGAAQALDFYKKVFQAEELFRMPGPDGKIMHAEMQIGSSKIMLADEFPDMNFKSPKSLGGSAVTLMLYVEDVDAWVKRAVEAGAKLTKPVENQFYGDRSGAVEDPSGHTWHIATHIEDLTPEQLEQRAKEFMKNFSC